LPFLVFVISAKRWWKCHQNTHAHLHRYMARNWETLQKEHTIIAHALGYQRSSKMTLDPIRSPSARLHHA
jgi:hypothetical protein